MTSAAKDILHRVKRSMGDALLAGRDCADFALDGIAPLGVVSPRTEQQVAELVKLCREGHVVVVPAGSRHQLNHVCPPEDRRPRLLISTRALKQVVNFSYEDMTITVQSGVLLSELDEITNAFGQHLPIDPPYAETATVGGLVATNTAGPRRLRHGAVADSILGGSMVLADGTLVHSGAKTVKSVAGYDLHKLFVGSYGSLGIVTQVIFKLKHVPEDFRIAEIRPPGIEDAAYITGQLMRGQTRPCMIELFDRPAACDLGRQLESEQVLLVVGYEDNSNSVEWQLTQLRATLGSQVTALDQVSSLELYRDIVEWPARACDYAFEVIVLGAKWNELMDYCAENEIIATARVGSGLVFGRGRGKPTTELVDALRRFAGPNGTVRFSRLPDGSPVSQWGEMDQARMWMRAVKEKFDPNRIFPWPGFLGQ